MKQQRAFAAYPFLAFLLIAAMGAAVYSNTFSSSFHWDDEPSLTANPAITDIRDLRGIWNFWPTRFVTYLSFAADYHFHRLDVTGYHVVNLLIHVGSALLVWLFFLLTFQAPWFKDRPIARHARLLALFGGLVFAAHPVQTAAVTYVVQRAASLAAFFYLASLCGYARFRLRVERGASPAGTTFFYAAALGAALLAMFTKEMAVTLPVMVLFYEFSFFRTPGKALRWRYAAPFFLVLAAVPATMWATRLVNLGEIHRSTELMPSLPPLRYFLTQLRVVVTYLRLAFFPLNQNVDYDYAVAQSLGEPRILASLLFLAGLCAFGVRLFRRQRMVSFGLFWFFIALAPESGLIPIRDVIFEHRLYLPMAGYCFLLAGGMYPLFGRRSARAMTLVLAGIVAAYAMLAFSRNAVWKDDLTLWSDAIRKSPNKARPYHIRGLAYQRAGEAGKAAADLETARTLDPVFVSLLYDNRMKTSLDRKDFDQVIADAATALELNPDDAVAYNSRGLAYLNQEDQERAFSDFNRAIELDPAFAAAYNNRGRVYEHRGDPQAALADFDRALSIMPRLEAARANRKELLDLLDAVARAGRVLAADPRNAEAYGYRGYAYLKLGRDRQAVADLSRALELDAGDAVALANRAVAYFKLNEHEKSLADIGRARALGRAVDPRFEDQVRQALKKEAGP
ncbi:MAG: tetratricopeptide repeat protein [Deltaproteobacteria bacterium]